MIILHACLKRCKEILENKELIQLPYKNGEFKKYLDLLELNFLNTNDVNKYIIQLPSFKFSLNNGVCYNADLFCLDQHFIFENSELVGLTEDECCRLSRYRHVDTISDHIAYTYFLKKYGKEDNIPSNATSLIYPITYNFRNLWLEDERWEYLNHVISYLEKMIERYEG